MKNLFLYAVLVMLIVACTGAPISGDETVVPNDPPYYLQNREPLITRPYLELPLGNIQARGWLQTQLQNMQNGLTGKLDSVYPEVVGARNGWLGGDGDGWERGPYWIDGLLPLAYLLDDDQLKQKAQQWVEWTLKNQTDEGYIGPVPFAKAPPAEPGLQRGNRKDWWPKMVMLKVLQQYYSATQDERVIDCLTRYFRYQLQELPNRPLDHLTLWANRRGGDNLQVVYWLYNITGDDFLLELGDLIYEQTFPWTKVFTNEENYQDPVTPWHYARIKRYPFDEAEINALTISKTAGFHCVNVAQGLKQPIIYYQRDQDGHYVDAVKKALKDLKKYHGQPQGMYGGDEPLHGNNPVQGIEFCSVAEEMFSLESVLQITGDLAFADQLERIVYNALPTQATDDFTVRQYFQAANQVELSNKLETSFETNHHGGTDFVFGTLTGYPCCTTNMHQSWPKYVQNLYYATPDRGVAALLYAPSSVHLLVADGRELQIEEETGFPFREEVNFTLTLDGDADFPFHMRVPSWCSNPAITINGTIWEGPIEDGLAVIRRTWKNGDVLQLKLPMQTTTSIWHEFSQAVERGPLVYALKIRGEYRMKDLKDRFRAFREVYPLDDWNYGLLAKELADPAANIQVVERSWDGSYPWNLDKAPIELKIKGMKIPDWKLTNGAPYFPAFWGRYSGDPQPIEEITLVPYGCTTLRITEFPVYDL
ncbi:MAG: glycoside hydrolase family 127 protein [Lewinella sp.]|nr:glycoside hydrolase family 127 protein [Lewinella sp.]